MNQRFKALWLAETIRLVEQNDNFADTDANRQAKSVQGSLTERILLRAKIIASQTDLLGTQQRYLKALRIAFILLFFFAIFVGAALSFTALSQQPINIFWALISLLGLNFLTLLIWIFSFLFIPTESGGFLIQTWFWLTGKLAQKQTTKQLFPALLSLSGNHLRWGIGFVVNLFWSIILFSSIFVLIILFSTKHYSFVWQTTLLSADTFILITQLLGTIPALIGFPIPDADTIRQSGELAISAGDVRLNWAVWLLGICVVYGLLIRVFFMLLCGVIWHFKQKSTGLNLKLPEYQVLAEQLQPFQSQSQIVDPDQKLSSYRERVSFDKSGIGAYLVAIDVDLTWRAPSSESFVFLGFLNQREQRQHILDYLQINPAQKLLIAIDTDRAPDRGAINLIIALSAKSMLTRLWLINEGKQYQNWCERVQTLSLLLALPEWLTEEVHNG